MIRPPEVRIGPRLSCCRSVVMLAMTYRLVKTYMSDVGLSSGSVWVVDEPSKHLTCLTCRFTLTNDGSRPSLGGTRRSDATRHRGSGAPQTACRQRHRERL